jgi:ATP-dependent helicase/nuclease subunit A
MTRTDAPSRIWTAEQTEAIHATGASILVSAAAGSGKTAVLAERCAQRVCDPDNPADVDELLVVTFTEQAAAEMKSRIAQAIHRRHRQTPTARLDRQLALVEQAQVSTLHSFCARILRQHFHLLELDPGFGVMDGDEADLLRSEIARELFDQRYQQEPDGLFDRLIDYYGQGDDAPILQRLLRTHDMLRSLIDPRDWMDRARRNIAESASGDFAGSPLGQQLHRSIAESLDALAQQSTDCDKLLKSLGGFDKYQPIVDQLRATFADWKDLLHRQGLLGLIQSFSTFEFPGLPAYSNNLSGKQLAKGAMDELKKRIKEGPLADFLRFTPDQWQQGLRTTLPYAELFLDLIGEFDRRYAQAKREIRAVDFTDLEQLALRILRDESSTPTRLVPSPVARTYHRRFKHVLVDEYQDINAVQDAILNLVSHECLDRPRPPRLPPNLFCVGDIKQSIYRFRLAEPRRFLDRQRQLAGPGSDGKIIHLQSNFRSRKPLLDAINALFFRLMSTEQLEIVYDQTHALTAGQAFPADGHPDQFTGAPIELHLIPTKADFDTAREPNPLSDEEDAQPFDRSDIEAALLAGRIRQMMGHDGRPPRQITEKDPAGQWVSRPIRYRDIVILLQAVHRKAEHYARILRRHDIPVHSAGGSGFFATTEIRDMLALLKLLDNLRQDIPLAALLRGPLANLPDRELSLARIRIAYPADDHPDFHEAVFKYAAEQKDELAAALRDILDRLGRWRELARTRPLAELLWTIYQTSGYLAFCSGLPNGAQRVANLIALHERARQFGRFQRQGLSRFLRFMDQLEREDDPAQPSIWSAADDAVRIMSIHKSKGLEFPVVIIPDLGKKFNTEDQSSPILIDRSAGLGLTIPDPDRSIRYPSLAGLMVKQTIHRQMLAEQLRVLYVGLTRAKEHLILIGTASQNTVDGWQALWTGRTNPPSPAELLKANTMLDWLGPAACAIGMPHIQMIQHAPADLDAITLPDSPSKSTDSLASLAGLVPLDPPPPPSPDAQRVIDRLTGHYPHAPYTQLPAVQSVTGWTKRATAEKPSPSQPFYSSRNKLAEPGFISPDSPPSAAERGNATHLVLQHLDFSLPCIGDDLRLQIQSMLDRKLISPAQSALVDHRAIEWFFSTDLATLLRRPEVDLRRELPFYLTCPPEQFNVPPSADPLDQVMVRGRMDLLALTPTELFIVDYKTDHLTPPQVPARAQLYSGQMNLYRQALATILNRPLDGMYLVFLTPRIVHLIH